MGYCGLGAEEDFVMDGGSGDGRPGKETFYAYYEGVLSELGALGADIYLLQEVDADSDRSCNFNEVEHFSEGRNARGSAYALNYSCPFVPFPWPPMGKVTSGILTTSDFAVEGGTAERIALPCPFSWPLQMCIRDSVYVVDYEVGEGVVRPRPAAEDIFELYLLPGPSCYELPVFRKHLRRASADGADAEYRDFYHVFLSPPCEPSFSPPARRSG